MITYDIELGLGDTDNIPSILKAGGVPVNLTGAAVTFSMTSESGVSLDIECVEGALVNGEYVGFDEGGVTVPFTSTHTATADLFFGKFLVVFDGDQVTFPKGDDYISVKIWEGV